MFGVSVVHRSPEVTLRQRWSKLRCLAMAEHPLPLAWHYKETYRAPTSSRSLKSTSSSLYLAPLTFALPFRLGLVISHDINRLSVVDKEFYVILRVVCSFSNLRHQFVFLNCWHRWRLWSFCNIYALFTSAFLGWRECVCTHTMPQAPADFIVSHGECHISHDLHIYV